MAYPTPGDYQEALQDPEAAFRDADLQKGRAEQGVLGLPRTITGAYAAVFPVQTATTRVAVKCFLSRGEDRARRYAAVAEHLEEGKLSTAVPFTFEPRGVCVRGDWYPLVRMPWVDGVALNRYVETHREDTAVMAALAEGWQALVDELEEAGVAHGDLQHGNVLVAGDADAPQLRLVDFDTTFVPALEGERSPEVGHRNYQHPDRDQHDFGRYLDRFAALVIYTALRAVTCAPELWTRYDTGENLLFRAADFYDPEGSPLFEELSRVDDVAMLARQLRRACLLEPEDVSRLTRVVAGEEVPAADDRPGRRRHGTAQQTQALRPVLGWGALAAAIVLAVLLGGFVGGAIAASTVAAALAFGWRRYRRQPRVRRRRRLRGEKAYYDALIEQLDAEIARVEEERRAAVEGTSERERRRLEEVREDALYDRLKFHFVQQAREAGLSHKVIVRLKAAGLRTAHDLTPDALRSVREVGHASAQRLLAWRQALVDEYADDLPDRLSPAEERRLENVLQHRLRDLDAERQRLQEKRRVQDEERAEVVQRLDRVPRLGFGRYVASVIGLAEPSDDAAGLPVPLPYQPSANAGRTAEPAEDDSAEDATDRAWWRQAS